MATKEDLAAWKQDSEGISFIEWLRIHRSPKEDNTSSPISNKNSEPKFIKKSNWKEFHVAKNLYLSKQNYEKLKNEDSISSKINKILTKFFQEQDNT